MILKTGLARFMEQKLDDLEVKLRGYCDEIIEKAIAFRLGNTRAHNFTGNLINSIVAALYRKGKLVIAVTPGSSDGSIDPPIRRKMTYPKKYYFGVNAKGELSKLGYDWDTVKSSYYEPEMVTSQRFGTADAKAFIDSFRADPKALFQIVVAYTTEYASFVESKRKTTGYLNTVQFIQVSAPKLVQQ